MHSVMADQIKSITKDYIRSYQIRSDYKHKFHKKASQSRDRNAASLPNITHITLKVII